MNIKGYIIDEFGDQILINGFTQGNQVYLVGIRNNDKYAIGSLPLTDNLMYNVEELLGGKIQHIHYTDIKDYSSVKVFEWFLGVSIFAGTMFWIGRSLFT